MILATASVAFLSVPISETPAASATCAAPQYPTPATAEAAFAGVLPNSSGARWFTGDGGWTILHPATCARLHIFGDSAVTNAAGQHVMLHGNAILQTEVDLRLVSSGSLIPDSSDGSIDWPGPLVWDGGKLYSFTSHVHPLPTGGWENIGKDLAEFNWDGSGGLTYQGKWVTPATALVSGVMWGAAVMRTASYVYVYGTMHQEGWFGSRVYLARVPNGKLHISQSWQFWTGSTWSKWERDAAQIISEFGGPADAFSAAYVNGQTILVSKKDGNMGSEVTKWVSSNGIGPWMTTKIMDIPWSETDQTYLVMAHYDMRYTDGTVPVTVSHGRGSSGSLGDMWDRPERYRNTWHAIAP